MKKLFIFSLCFIISLAAFSQKIDESTELNNLGESWVLDSIHQYRGYLGEDIFLEHRELVTSRNSDGKVTSKLYLSRKSSLADWVKNSRFTQSYYENGKKNEYHVQQYDSKRNIWLDSIRYRKNDENGAMILQMSKGWDINLGNITYGSKEFKEYDSKKRLVSKLDKKWDKEGEVWVNYQKTIFSYSSTDKIIEKVIQDWVQETGEWINVKKSQWTYNSEDNVVEILTLKWSNGIWQNSYKKYIEYTDGGKTKLILNQNWNIDKQEWENDTKLFYVFDGDKKIRKISQSWIISSSAWFDYIVNKSKYNAEGLLSEDEYMFFSLDTSIGDTGVKYNYTYNSNKKVSFLIQRKWNPINSIWEKLKKRSYNYDSGETKILAKWDIINNVWVNESYYQYKVNEQGQTIFTISRNWNITDNLWDNVRKTVNIYDDFNNLIQAGYFNWNAEGEEWYLTKRVDYFRSLFTTKVVDYINPEYDFYPNPVGDVMYISPRQVPSKAKVEIFNLQGGKLLEFALAADYAVDVSKIEPGTYILKIITENGIWSGLFIVQR